MLSTYIVSSMSIGKGSDAIVGFCYTFCKHPNLRWKNKFSQSLDKVKTHLGNIHPFTTEKTQFWICISVFSYLSYLTPNKILVMLFALNNQLKFVFCNHMIFILLTILMCVCWRKIWYSITIVFCPTFIQSSISAEKICRNHKHFTT